MRLIHLLPTVGGIPTVVHIPYPPWEAYPPLYTFYHHRRHTHRCTHLSHPGGIPTVVHTFHTPGYTPLYTPFTPRGIPCSQPSAP